MSTIEARTTNERPATEPAAGWVSDALAGWTTEPAFHHESDDDVFMTECPEWCEGRPHSASATLCTKVPMLASRDGTRSSRSM